MEQCEKAAYKVLSIIGSELVSDQHRIYKATLPVGAVVFIYISVL